MNIHKISDTDTNWGILWREREGANAVRRTKGLESLRIFRERSNMRSENFNEYVSRSDREKIAAALFLEIERLTNHPDRSRKPITRAQLMVWSGLSQQDEANPTKRLHELLLPSHGSFEEINKRRAKLRATHDHYLRIIDILIGLNPDESEDLCDRIFLGTSYSGIEADINRNRRLILKIENSINKIDKMISSFSSMGTLARIFDESARLKKSLQEHGSTTNWPYFDLSEPFDFNSVEPPHWRNPYWAENYDSYVALPYSDKRRCTMFPTCLDWNDAVLSLPRIYLGCAVSFRDWGDVETNTAERNLWFQEISENQREIAELRSLSSRCTGIVWQNEESAQYNKEHYRDGNQVEYEGHCWLVIYPSSDGRSLCPMFYWNLADGGVHVCQLDPHTIDVLSELHVTSGCPAKILTVFEYLVDLLENKSCLIEAEWARTTFDLLENPILKEVRAGQLDSKS